MEPSADHLDVPRDFRKSGLRKRDHDDPSEDNRIVRERSTSRHREVQRNAEDQSTTLKAQHDILQYREAPRKKEKMGREYGNWEKRPIRQRKRGVFCHVCEKQRPIKEDFSCGGCGHEICVLCLNKWTD
ncbi:hypothetical protein N657DRAFT_649713 [Parathielavia appendiculata]|uniref:Uncharacterized protein n=1 Tax=Parathielavia appendiculata TaxID=2587402 RepID=A0AAN6TSN0_9PEZI|nr:hypothetical protein N657DRAFT_649713 [Parathielavia appendiculata]